MHCQRASPRGLESVTTAAAKVGKNTTAAYFGLGTAVTSSGIARATQPTHTDLALPTIDSHVAISLGDDGASSHATVTCIIRGCGVPFIGVV